MQKADAAFCKQYDESRAIIRQLETAGKFKLISQQIIPRVLLSMRSFLEFFDIDLNYSC